MSEEKREQKFGSLYLRRASGAKLISAQIATEIARLVLREQYGQTELDRNEPFSIVEDGDTWIVRGKDPPKQAPQTPPDIISDGPFKMQISQYDGQIF